MPIDSKHPQYADKAEKWAKCRSVFEGEDAVKKASTKHLPKLSGQTDDEYAAYKQRALFYGATARTVTGIVGAIMRKEPVVELPDALKDYTKDITSGGITLDEFAKALCEHLFITSRVGILCDRPPGTVGEDKQRPYLVLYGAEDIINWREQEGQLVLVVLREDHFVVDKADPYTWKKKFQFRELILAEKKYKQVIHSRMENEDKFIKEEMMPQYRGEALQEIPFVFISPKGTTVKPEKPALLDLVNVNLSHYRTSADLEHGRHFTALPTPWFSGIADELGKAVHIGSSKAIILPPPEARAGFLEFKGDGLKALETASEEKKDMMAKLGARLLETHRKGVESAETARIHASGEASVAVQIANAVSSALEQALGFMAQWDGLKDVDISVTLNTDLIDARMDPKMLTALLAVRQAGELTAQSFSWNLARGELLHPELSIEDERELLETEAPSFDEGGEEE